MASESGKAKTIQIFHYLKRNPNFKREEFWEYWTRVHGPKIVPLAEKYGFQRYQQLRTSGLVVSNSSAECAPNAVSAKNGGATTEPVEFDGIAMFLVPSLDSFSKAVEDPYYLNVVEPDEHNLIDKDAVGGGVVASFQGKMVTVVHDGVNAMASDQDLEVKRAREYYKEWEIKTRKSLDG